MPTSRGTVMRYLLIVAGIALAPLLLSHLNPHPAGVPVITRPTTTGPTPTIAPDSTQAPPAGNGEPAMLGYGVPPISGRQIRAAELGLAHLGGDPRPAWIMAVTTTLSQALRDAPRVRPGRDSPPVVYLVIMKGNFAFSTVSTLGVDVTSGHYMAAIYTPVTMTPLGMSITSQAPVIPLSRLGPVTDLLRIRPAGADRVRSAEVDHDRRPGDHGLGQQLQAADQLG